MNVSLNPSNGTVILLTIAGPANAPAFQNIFIIVDLSDFIIIFAKIRIFYEMEYNPQVILSPADFADTGQWRLIIYITPSSIRGMLKHVSDPSRPLVELLNVNWPDTDPANLLQNIENAIYDHPALLDDYATEIILRSSAVCFAPNSVIDENDDSEARIFTTLFPGKDQEILSDRLQYMTALFSMARGIDGFVSRTIPGARIRSHLAVLVEYFAVKHSQSSINLFLDIRENEADVILLKNGGLLSASVQLWKTPEDLTYRIFNLLNAYSVSHKDVKINLSGLRDVRISLTDILRRLGCEVSALPLPSNPSAAELPLPLLIRMTN